MADLGNIAESRDYFLSSPGGVISGTVKDSNGDFASRLVTLLSDPKTDGSGLRFINSKNSDSVTGEFSFPAAVGVAYTVVVSGEPDRNSIIYTGVTPE
jgi:hypothetical protein